MRWVALLLLAANLGLAGWQFAGTPGWSPTGERPPPELGTLALLDADEEISRAAGGCYTLGPFEDPGRARAARARLAALGLEPRQRRTVEEEPSGYQVLLPPFASADAALDAARELARRGIEDYFIIVSEPELRNAVSVGLFQEQRSAERRVEDLEQLGFEPEVRLRTRSRTRYWQDYRDPAGDAGPGFIESLGAAQPLQRLERSCGGRP